MSFASKSIFGDHELIQAMPLDTNKAQTGFLSGSTPTVIFTLADETKLVEITVLPIGDSPDTVYVRMTDADAPLSGNPVNAGKTTYAVVTEFRELTVFLIVPATGSFIVYVMEA